MYGTAVRVRPSASAEPSSQRVDEVGWNVRLALSVLPPIFSLVAREGPAALLAGWWPAYCRLAPHAILTFPLLEQLRRLAGLENF